MNNTSLSERELEDRYNDFLDEVFGDSMIGGYAYHTSRALKEVDPTAYRCGFNDWLDSELQCGILFEKNNEYYDKDPYDGN
jgi:hypothetical protein